MMVENDPMAKSNNAQEVMTFLSCVMNITVDQSTTLFIQRAGLLQLAKNTVQNAIDKFSALRCGIVFRNLNQLVDRRFRWNVWKEQKFCQPDLHEKTID